MVKLKDILLETKFGHLVEDSKKKKSTKKKPAKKKEKTGNPALDKEYKLTSKATNKEIPKTGKQIKDMGAKQGKIYKNYPQVIKQIDKNLDKQEKDKAQKKSEEDKITKIKNTDVKALDKKSGKKISVKVDKVLPPPFGSAKEIDDSVPGTKEAKKVVYDAKVAEAQEEATKEAEKRKKKNKGKFKLTAEEQKEFNAWKEENEYFIDDDFTEEEWFTKQRPKEEMSVFNPEDGEQWEENPEDYLGDDGEFDGGWGEKDKFGNALADELGGESQVEAMANKLDLPKETFIPATKETKVIKNKHGQNVAIKIFRNNKDGQYYAVDDEGNVYKTKSGGKIDLDDPNLNDSFEHETDLSGYPGAQTSDGVSRAEDREPEEWDDMGDSTSFSDLLDLLGLEDDGDF
tara:strand:- start:83 stop:1285 length:1203 start_codon:yes stop_codon:yes gene_type:complete